MPAHFRTFRMPAAATLLLLCLAAATAWAAPVKVQMQITGYVINADLDPAVNRLTATADVTVPAASMVMTRPPCRIRSAGTPRANEAVIGLPRAPRRQREQANQYRVR